jgi:hypothetical protein
LDSCCDEKTRKPDLKNTRIEVLVYNKAGVPDYYAAYEIGIMDLLICLILPFGNSCLKPTLTPRGLAIIMASLRDY